jgi:hypothetical protein
MPTLRLDCRRCTRYFVTWDEHFPHGCRCMGFKSRRLPSEEVRQAMNGVECALFELKSAARLSSDPPAGVKRVKAPEGRPNSQ